MSEYPKKLVSAEGGVAMVNDSKDEATLKALGYEDVPTQQEETQPKVKPLRVREPTRLQGRPRKP